MVKCSICKNKVEETFLKKIMGTYVKKKAVCSECQRKYSLEELKKKV